jgi:hypothetical protein
MDKMRYESHENAMPSQLYQYKLIIFKMIIQHDPCDYCLKPSKFYFSEHKLNKETPIEGTCMHINREWGLLTLHAVLLLQTYTMRKMFKKYICIPGSAQ